MKKKALLSLALIAVLAFGVGLGTYAWFTASVTSLDNEFEVGTFEINGNYGNASHALFSTILQKPGDPATVFTPLLITNTGSLDMDVRALVEITPSYVSGVNVGLPIPDLAEYTVTAVAIINGVSNPFIGTPYEFETWLEALTGTLANGGTITLDGSIALNSTAQNDYQGLELLIDVNVYAKQTNATWADTYPGIF